MALLPWPIITRFQNKRVYHFQSLAIYFNSSMDNISRWVTKLWRGVLKTGLVTCLDEMKYPNMLFSIYFRSWLKKLCYLLKLIFLFQPEKHPWDTSTKLNFPFKIFFAKNIQLHSILDIQPFCAHQWVLYMLTLESECIPVLGWGVLCIRTLHNC